MGAVLATLSQVAVLALAGHLVELRQLAMEVVAVDEEDARRWDGPPAAPGGGEPMTIARQEGLAGGLESRPETVERPAAPSDAQVRADRNVAEHVLCCSCGARCRALIALASSRSAAASDSQRAREQQRAPAAAAQTQVRAAAAQQQPRLRGEHASASDTSAAARSPAPYPCGSPASLPRATTTLTRAGVASAPCASRLLSAQSPQPPSNSLSSGAGSAPTPTAKPNITPSEPLQSSTSTSRSNKTKRHQNKRQSTLPKRDQLLHKPAPQSPTPHQDQPESHPEAKSISQQPQHTNSPTHSAKLTGKSSQNPNSSPNLNPKKSQKKQQQVFAMKRRKAAWTSSSATRQQPIDIRPRLDQARLAQIEQSTSTGQLNSRHHQLSTCSAASSLDSGHSSGASSNLDLSVMASDEPHLSTLASKSSTLHPNVSALLLSTASLTLTKNQPKSGLQLSQSVSVSEFPNTNAPPQPSPAKRTKKQQLSCPSRNNQFSSTELSSSFDSSSTSTSSSCPPSPIKIATQDSTYLPMVNAAAASQQQYGQVNGPPKEPLMKEPPPARPWLSAHEQLQCLSRGKLKQLHFAGRLDSATLKTLLSHRKSPSSSNLQPTRISSPDEFTVLSYNVLSDRMVSSERFPSSPNQALDWHYRRELILKQLLDHGNDVIALQELEMEQYEMFFKPKLEELGQYCGIFESKSRARTMDPQMRKRVDGCAIFFKRHKFKLVARHLLEFSQIAMANACGSEAMLNRVQTKDNIGLVAVLELSKPDECNDRNETTRADNEQRNTHQVENHHDGEYSSQNEIHKPAPQRTSKRLVVCNTHIHWNPESCDVKLIQTIMLMNELKHIARHHSRPDSCSWNDIGSKRHQQQPAEQQKLGGDIAFNSQEATSKNSDLTQMNPPNADLDQDDMPLLPIVILGDFNSLQSSGVVSFLLQGQIDSSHKDFKEFKYTPCSNALALKRHFEWQLGQQASLSRRPSQPPPQPHKRPVAPLETLTPTTFQTLMERRRRSSPITTSPASTALELTPPPSEPSTSPGPFQTQTMPPTAEDLPPLKPKLEIIHYKHPFQLSSAYEHGLMPFTNYTTRFSATIDYIFFARNQIELVGLLGPLDKRWLKRNKITGFPQMQFPSDHLPLVAKFKLLDTVAPNNSPQAGQAPAMWASSSGHQETLPASSLSPKENATNIKCQMLKLQRSPAQRIFEPQSDSNISKKTHETVPSKPPPSMNSTSRRPNGGQSDSTSAGTSKNAGKQKHTNINNNKLQQHKLSPKLTQAAAGPHQLHPQKQNLLIPNISQQPLYSATSNEHQQANTPRRKCFAAAASPATATTTSGHRHSYKQQQTPRIRTGQVWFNTALLIKLKENWS